MVATAAGNGLLYPILGLMSCIAFIYMSFGGDVIIIRNNPVTRYDIDTEMGFVTTNGTQFVIDGMPFYVNGWNSYWLLSQAAEDSGRHRVRKMFQTGKKMGLTVCRTWAFNDGDYNALQVSLGRFDERVFKALDLVIAEARRHGIRLLLSLSNNLQAYGGKRQYAKWAWEEGIGLSSSNDSFFFDPSIRTYFKIYIKTLLTRKNHLTGIEYRDDPTIFAWELMNEPRCPSDPSGNTLQGWLEEMTAYVKSLDNKHMLTAGFEGFYGPTSPAEKISVNPEEYASNIGVDFIRNSKVRRIDFTSAHLYADQWFVSRRLDLAEKISFVTKYMTSHIEDGDNVLGKPILFTEFGLSKRYKEFDDSDRDKFYTPIFDIVYDSARNNRSGAGSFIWQLMEANMEECNDDYGIVPADRASLYRLIREQSRRLAAVHYGHQSIKRRSF